MWVLFICIILLIFFIKYETFLVESEETLFDEKDAKFYKKLKPATYAVLIQ